MRNVTAMGVVMSKNEYILDSSKYPTMTILMAKDFQPTCNLRWSESKELLQAWMCVNTGEIEWKQIATFDSVRDGNKSK